MAPKIVGFLTDFGLKDPYVGQVKAVMLSLNPELLIVDLGHLIESFCVTCGAYSVYSSYKFLPEGSGILAVVDPGVGSSRKALVAEAFNRVFVGPDNGILWQVLSEDDAARVYEIDSEKIKLGWERSSTFHGRDLFGPAMAIALREGVEAVAGRRVGKGELVKLSLRESRRERGRECFRVVYVDRFGNVALSALREDYDLSAQKGGLLLVSSKGVFSAHVASSFSLVPRGEFAVYFNSFGFLEIAVNQGSASQVLGVGVGDWVCIGRTV